MIPLEREEPAVVFALAFRTANSSPSLPDGGSVFTEQRIALAAMLERLDNDAAMGMFTYPPQGNTEVCQPPTELRIPIAPHNAADILASYDSTGFSQSTPPIAAAIRLGLDALEASGVPARSRFLIVTDDEGRCGYHGEREMVQTARLSGVRTFVIGLWDFAHNDPMTLLAAALAREGGVDAYLGPDGFVDPVDLVTLRRAMDEVIVAPSYCRLHVSEPPPNAEAFDLQASGGMAIPRDRTRNDGWDWTDVARGQMEIFGPWCDAVGSARAASFLVSARVACPFR